VELLIVVAVTVILAWILLPVFAESKASSRNGQDIRNFRDLTMTLMLYTDDHDDRYVPVGAPVMDLSWSPAKNSHVDASGKPWNRWAQKLRPYAKSDQPFRSPSTGEAGFSGPCSHADGMELTSTYTFNWLLGRDGSYSAEGYARTPSGLILNRPITTDSVHRLGNTIAFTSSPYAVPSVSDKACLRTTLQASDFSNELFVPSTYQDGGNVSFADGHTHWYRSAGVGSDQKSGPIYSWPSYGIWMQPTMPEDSLGYKNGNGVG
jgi:prepilin-type processing-associated H-X9-DG protein